jgi:hypothetical protein
VVRQIKAAAYIILAFNISMLTSRATVTFSDSTFSPANWTASKILDTTSSQTATFSISQQSSGGNPAFYQQDMLSYTSTAGGQGVRGASLFNPSVYNPSLSGAINSISFSFDREYTGRSGGTPDPFFGLVVFQGSTYYETTASDTPFGTWMNLSGSALTANDFSNVAGPGGLHPDFSATGAPLTFGYADGTGSGPATITLTTGVDNFDVTINNVPEPGTWAIGALATGLLAFQIIRAARVQPKAV